jgi:hypothetical protein
LKYDFIAPPLISLNLNLAKSHPQVEYITTENSCQSPTLNLSKNFAKLSHPPHPMISNAAPSFTYFLPLHGFAALAQTQRWREAVPASVPLFRIVP